MYIYIYNLVFFISPSRVTALLWQNGLHPKRHHFDDRGLYSPMVFPVVMYGRVMYT